MRKDDDVIDIYFHPIWMPEVPTLRVTEIINTRREFRFQCIDSKGDTHAETFHVNLVDALQQVISRMHNVPSGGFNRSRS